MEDFTTDDRQVYLVKTDPMGELAWEKFYGDTKNDEGKSIAVTSNGYLMACITKSYGSGLNDVWLISTNMQGEVQWDTVFGGAKDDIAYSILALDSGEFIIAGSTASYGKGMSDAWVLKTSNNGDLLWNITLGGDKNDIARKIIQTTDNGFMLVGDTASYGAGWNDVWLVKISEDGEAQWNQTYGGSANDIGKSIRETDDGYIIVGTSESFGDSLTQGYLIKVDSTGAKSWEQNYGGALDDYLEDVEIYEDGYLAVGYTPSATGESDVWILQTSSSGELVQEETIGGDLRDRAYEVLKTQDGGFILPGFTYSYGSAGNGFLIKLTTQEPETEQEPEPEPEPEPEAEPETQAQDEESGGIPAYPLSSIVLGITLLTLFVQRKRTQQSPIF